ncbi:MAG: PD-(D/E)XK nuclease family protein [Planctomycetota bacterium]
MPEPTPDSAPQPAAPDDPPHGALGDAPALAPAEALAALESFVVDNDDLVALEERIGRFNIFDALGIVRAEIHHSAFLAWLLDPGESHRAGQVFLRAVLMDMLRNASHAGRPMSPVELDGLELGGVEVRREADNIDILIAADDPKLVVAIENKIDSGEHSGQLGRYRGVVARKYPRHRPLFVFLTREGDEPSDDAWTSYSYADLHATLSRVRKLHADALGDDVRAFLDHYLRMIGSRFMDDPKIDELCDRIYRNHRQAIDLIFERRADPRRLIVEAFADGLTATGYPGQTSDKRSSSYRYDPQEWLDLLPAINARPMLPPTAWIAMTFRVGARMRRATVEVVVGPTTDPAVRTDLLKRIQNTGNAHGFTLPPGKQITDRWTRIYSQAVLNNKQGFEADEATLEKARAAGESMATKLAGMTPFFREVFADR